MAQVIKTKGKVPRLKMFAPAIPYLAVIIGMYLMESAWTSILLYHAGIVTTLVVANYWYFGHTLKRKQDLAVLIAVVLLSAAAGVIIYVFWPTLILAELSLAITLSDLGLSQTAWILFIFYYFTVNPVLEELFWRGYLGNDTKSLAWTDIWFAGYHVLITILFVKIPWVILSFLVLVISSWIWRQLTRHYRGLLIPILSHAAADASIIWATFFLSR